MKYEKSILSTYSIHSHVQWEISETRTRVSFPALVRVRPSLASIAIMGDVSCFFEMDKQSSPGLSVQ